MRSDISVAEAMDYWLRHRELEVRGSTLKMYRQFRLYIVGPLLVGTRVQRLNFSRRGIVPSDATFLEMLGAKKIHELKPAIIRAWHRTLVGQVGGHSANVAKKLLRTILSLAAEDLEVPLPVLPARMGRGLVRPKKQILTPNQVGALLRAAKNDADRGVYYAFPFLTGVRPSEQLALLWADVDLNERVIHIRRSQEPDGTASELTKTTAGLRDIPIAPTLHRMLAEWHTICPPAVCKDHRVFPCLGRGAGGKTCGRPLSYQNFIRTYWRPALAALGLPMVTPHSARHAFISTLQANGIEVGLVAELAGHADPTITLGYYTQAVRKGTQAIDRIERMYRGEADAPPIPSSAMAP
jgi:integrase